MDSLSFIPPWEKNNKKNSIPKYMGTLSTIQALSFEVFHTCIGLQSFICTCRGLHYSFHWWTRNKNKSIELSSQLVICRTLGDLYYLIQTISKTVHPTTICSSCGYWSLVCRIGNCQLSCFQLLVNAAHGVVERHFTTKWLKTIGKISPTVDEYNVYKTDSERIYQLNLWSLLGFKL